MVFQDGRGFLDPDDDLRSAVVLDNLIAAQAIPEMVGTFVDPGVFPGIEDARQRKNRNAEYDAFDARYPDFLVHEVLTAAWHRPEAFRKVIGFSSSFAQMPGGNPYPQLIATEPARPMRIFIQVGHRDLGWDEPEYNWLAENLRSAAALAEGGYDFRLVHGDGGHAANHAGVLLPDALRWLWRD